MLEEYQQEDSGYWACVYCGNQPLLPSGLSDIPSEAMVKLYCLKCLDVNTHKSLRHLNVDGIYFGTGFPHMLFTVHPNTGQRGPPTRLCPGSMISRSIQWSTSSSSKPPATSRALLRRFTDSSPDLTLSLRHIHSFATTFSGSLYGLCLN